jgi:hypothetical protein
MTTLMPLPVVALISGAILALVALLALELLAVRRINRIMGPAMEYARAKAEEEAEHILETARENARAVLARAEAAGAALSAERAKEDEGARHAHEEALREARERFDSSLAELKKAAEAAGSDAREGLQKELASLGEGAKRELAEAVKEAAAKFAADLEGALAEAREGAKAYQKARMDAVDVHIRELVAQTTTLTLARSLPEAATTELVLKALEDAKAAHAL